MYLHCIMTVVNWWIVCRQLHTFNAMVLHVLSVERQTTQNIWKLSKIEKSNNNAWFIGRCFIKLTICTKYLAYTNVLYYKYTCSIHTDVALIVKANLLYYMQLIHNPAKSRYTLFGGTYIHFFTIFVKHIWVGK